MKQNWNFSVLWISSMSGGRRIKHMLKKNPLCLHLNLMVALWCFGAGTGNLQHVL